MGEAAEREGDRGRGGRHDARRALHDTGQHCQLRRREPLSPSSQSHHSYVIQTMIMLEKKYIYELFVELDD